MAFTYLKVKPAKCLGFLPVVLVLFWSRSCKQRSWSWSWSCYIGLGPKNLVSFTSLDCDPPCTVLRYFAFRLIFNLTVTPGLISGGGGQEATSTKIWCRGHCYPCPPKCLHVMCLFAHDIVV